jgi:hypothetical protein
LLSEIIKYIQIQIFRYCIPGRRAVFDLRTNMKHKTVLEILSRMLQKPKIISKTKTEAAAGFSPSLEADDSSESHGVDRVIPNPKVRYRVYNNT